MEVLSRMTPAPPLYSCEFAEHGTTVSVKDLFGNMPVRVKHRHLVDQASGTTDRAWKTLTLTIIAYLLVCPKQLTIKLSNIDTGKSMAMSNRPMSSCHSIDSASTSLATQGALPLVARLLAQSTYTDLCRDQSWIPASASSKLLSISGVIGTQPSPSKSLQFISIDGRPLLPLHGFNELHDYINRLFRKSDFGVDQADIRLDRGNSSSISISRESYTAMKQKELKSGRKGIDRWPMFDLHITFKLNNSHYQTHMLTDNNILAKVEDVLEALVNGWLSAHRFLKPNLKDRAPTAFDKAPTSSTASDGSVALEQRYMQPLYQSPGQKSRDTEATPHSSASSLPRRSRSELRLNSSSLYHTQNQKQKVENHETSRKPFRQLREETNPIISIFQGRNTPAKSSNSIEMSLHNTPRETEQDLMLIKSLNRDQTEDTDIVDSLMTWNDPVTKRSHTVNARTGMPMQDAFAEHQHPTSNRLTLRTGSSQKEESTVAWISDLRETWKNPVFEPIVEEAITTSRLDYTQKNGQSRAGDPCCRHHNPEFQDSFHDVWTSRTGRFSRESLKQARVIQQVNKQFVLVALPTDIVGEESGELLVAIDQHAADERIRVEELYSKLCERNGDGDMANRTELHTPIIFQTSGTELDLFTQHSVFFQRWGIHYRRDETEKAGQSLPLALLVTSLPSVIAERCKLEPRLLIDMLRKELWSMTEGSHTGTIPLSWHDTPDSSTSQWLRDIGNCPQGILEMVNSRACRSAIMFNDYLSMEQCIQLVVSLSKCVFPFQCAHGRPSMVPLLRLDSGTMMEQGSAAHRECAATQTRSLSFAKAMNKWQEGET